MVLTEGMAKKGCFTRLNLKQRPAGTRITPIKQREEQNLKHKTVDKVPANQQPTEREPFAGQKGRTTGRSVKVPGTRGKKREKQEPGQAVQNQQHKGTLPGVAHTTLGGKKKRHKKRVHPEDARATGNERH